MNVGIIGNGYVGKATAMIAGCCNVRFNDKDESKSNCSVKEMVKTCDLIFICVPTPMKRDGSCYLDIVRGVMSKLRILGARSNRVILRSTVPVGTSDELEVNFMPEFLTEKNWEEDVRNCKDWIVGLHKRTPPHAVGVLKSKLKKLMLAPCKHSGLLGDGTIHYCSTEEAEICKYIRNAFLATKVSFFNEIHEFCQKAKVDYKVAKDLAVFDERITSSHTDVPGPDGKKGFGGTCFPKDIASLNFQMLKLGISPYIIDAVISRNIRVDRKERDWEKDKGRAVR